jgi:hypothetical protein
MNDLQHRVPLASAGEGSERYTLTVPYTKAATARDFDVKALCDAVSVQLQTGVSHEARNGYELIRVSPFVTASAAREAFVVVWSALARTAAMHGYPMFFQSAVEELTLTPGLRLLDGRKVYARACLAVPQVIPEHEVILDDGVLIGRHQPQIIESHLAATFESPFPTTTADAVTRLALDFYLYAFATDNVPLHCVGLVTALEVLLDRTMRSGEHTRALEGIASAVSGMAPLGESAAWEQMKGAVLQFVRTLKEESTSARIAALFEAHAEAIRNAAGQNPLVDDLSKLARDIYGLRSKVVHRGAMENSASTWALIRTLRVAVRAVLLERLEGRMGRARSAEVV